MPPSELSIALLRRASKNHFLLVLASPRFGSQKLSSLGFGFLLCKWKQRRYISHWLERMYGKQHVISAGSFGYYYCWSFLPCEAPCQYERSPQWPKVSMILSSGVFPPPFCWLPPRLLSGVISCCLPLQWQCSLLPWYFLGDLMCCVAPVKSSDRGPRFRGVSSDLKPSVGCPWMVSSQAGPWPL